MKCTSQKTIRVKILRFDPTVDDKPHYQTYPVPSTRGMSALDVLDYIYENLDGSLAYYDHAACRHGVCGGCSLLVNGKPSLACQTEILSDTTMEPIPKFGVVRDLVYRKGGVQ